MAKVRGTKGRTRFHHVKELGGAVRRESVSAQARVLVERGLIRGRVLDYGCGHGFDADHFGWDAFDPQYRQDEPAGRYDTIVCHHVANILTRQSRRRLFERIHALLSTGGVAYFSVSRNIPTRGKAGVRRRIQNYVVLTLPSVYRDERMEIYRMERDAEFCDRTREFEHHLGSPARSG